MFSCVCWDSERNERREERFRGTEKVPFGVQSSENEFQTCQREPRVDHEERAKSVEGTTQGAMRGSKEAALAE